MPPQYELKAKERINKGLPKYTQILQQAAQRGINEQDTSTIVQSMLVDLLGYDRFSELTGQYEVKGHWADWAVKADNKIHFFVEVKALGNKLRERDLFQVTSYSHQHSLEWAVLTTGDIWQCYRICNGKDPEEFFEISLLSSNQTLEETANLFYLLSKEAFSRNLMQERWANAEIFRPEKLAEIMLSEEVLCAVRRALRQDNSGRRIDIGELRDAIARGVIRGDLYEKIASATAIAPKKSGKRSGKDLGQEGQHEEPVSSGENKTEFQAPVD
jgi:hypothetical protein